ncbi:iron ABC transporter permease [Alkalihalobacillus oceani]|uniref:FecCD family ABC transporter permease n=1 Tax=Halalkalibacter oceani TaxID=1653776 RepID=UPI002040BC54|nr:iron ABC transporter permease [Halalkalibacter oceani]MCM3762944.1 iron ABC transporter permease [Halalkalibacter oceani]
MRKQFIQRYLANNLVIAYASVLLFCIGALIVSISWGSVRLPFLTVVHIILQEVFSVPVNQTLDPMFINIVMEIRFPRALLAMLVGASLALAGAAFQGFLKNPLADPYTLGVSSGAAVGAVAVLFFSFSLPLIGRFTLPLVSVLAGFATLFLVILFARLVQRSMATETIILAGIIFSSFLGAFISLMIALTGEELRHIISWLMGSVAMRGWSYIWLMLPFFLTGFLLLFFCRKELNALAFGEETARQLGVNIAVRRVIILLGATTLTGGAVAVSGTIGFVGLVIPHLTRLLWGPDHRHLLPLSMFVGAGFLALTDLVARTIIAPTELPIGVITAIVGAPVFAAILLRQRRLQA